MHLLQNVFGLVILLGRRLHNPIISATASNSHAGHFEWALTLASPADPAEDKDMVCRRRPIASSATICRRVVKSSIRRRTQRAVVGERMIGGSSTTVARLLVAFIWSQPCPWWDAHHAPWGPQPGLEEKLAVGQCKVGATTAIPSGWATHPDPYRAAGSGLAPSLGCPAPELVGVAPHRLRLVVPVPKDARS